jgi:hypothetical protein
MIANVIILNIFFVGSQCSTKSNEKGICVHIRNCPSIFDLFQRGKIKENRPKICSNTERSVCCPIEEVPQIYLNLEVTTRAAKMIGTKRISEMSIRNN